MGIETVSSDKRYDRGFRSLTSEYVRERLERLDEMLADPTNERRFVGSVAVRLQAREALAGTIDFRLGRA